MINTKTRTHAHTQKPYINHGLFANLQFNANINVEDCPGPER